MKESTSREKVLKSIRDALVNPMHMPGDFEDYTQQIYNREGDDDDFIDVLFAEMFSAVGGGFLYCANHNELLENIKSLVATKDIHNLFCFENPVQQLLADAGIEFFNDDEQYKSCQAAITQCEFLIARLGSVMVSSMQGWGRKGIAYAPIHIVVATRQQLVYDIHDALEAMKEKYSGLLPSMVSVITGASRTADIEKTLVMGAHGPEEIYVCFVDNDQ